MPGTFKGLRKLSAALDELSVQSMLIGGMALAAYGRIRATAGVDVAIASNYEKTVALQRYLQSLGYQVPSPPNRDAPLFVVTDLDEMLEVELWTKPDGVTFDHELLRRRVKVRPFNDNFEMYAIGPEDFVVNKLARADRGVQDELDAFSVLALQRGKLDYLYLRKRARQAGVIELVEAAIQQSNTNS